MILSCNGGGNIEVRTSGWGFKVWFVDGDRSVVLAWRESLEAANTYALDARTRNINRAING